MNFQPVMTYIGNLTDEPELRFTPTGAAVARFTLAHNPRVFNKDTNKWEQGEAEYMVCKVWGSLAENVAESLTKGTRVIAYGEMKLNRWEDKETKAKRSQWELHAGFVGPDLNFAQAKVTKMTRTAGNANSADDEWANATPARP